MAAWSMCAPSAVVRFRWRTERGRAHALAELAGTALASRGAVTVGISMNLSDVHVNRAPIAGRVRAIAHVPGSFGSLRDPEMLFSNERVTTIIESADMQIALVQIASRLVRRIVTFVSGGDALQLGQRIGAIRFGSQVNLLLPARPDIRLTVQVGDRVVAGRTIVALVAGEPAVTEAFPSADGAAVASAARRDG